MERDALNDSSIRMVWSWLSVFHLPEMMVILPLDPKDYMSKYQHHIDTSS